MVPEPFERVACLLTAVEILGRIGADWERGFSLAEAPSDQPLAELEKLTTRWELLCLCFTSEETEVQSDYMISLGSHS